jgi:hypothetical protein
MSPLIRPVFTLALPALLLGLGAVPAAQAASPKQAAPPAASSAVAPLPASWAPLGFLVGQWEGLGNGAPGASAGGFTLLPELAGHVLVRRSFAETAQGRHEDLMIIYQDPAGMQAFYSDNEGHTIRYAVTAEKDKAVFLSEEAGGGPRFRLSYELNPDSTLKIAFDIAPPGGASFKTYTEGTARRR